MYNRERVLLILRMRNEKRLENDRMSPGLPIFNRKQNYVLSFYALASRKKQELSYRKQIARQLHKH